MPAGDAGDPPCRCGSERGEGTRLIRGRIRVPAPLASPGVSGWRDGGALELRPAGRALGGEGAFGEGDGPCNLSKSCFLRGFSVQGGVSPARRWLRRVQPGRVGSCRRRGSGSENCCSLTFLHYITSNLPQLSVITNSHASDFYTNSKSMHSSLPLAAERLFPSKIFSFTRSRRPRSSRPRRSHGGSRSSGGGMFLIASEWDVGT